MERTESKLWKIRNGVLDLSGRTLWSDDVIRIAERINNDARRVNGRVNGHVAYYDTITTLILNNTRMTDEMLNSLCNEIDENNSLKTLDLSYNFIKDVRKTNLSKFKRLETLILSNTQSLPEDDHRRDHRDDHREDHREDDDEDDEEDDHENDDEEEDDHEHDDDHSEYDENAREISYENAGEAIATNVAKKLPNLKSLNLSDSNVDKKGMLAIVSTMSKLTTLDLSFNRIGVDELEGIGQNIPDLVSLDLSQNFVSNQSINAISECPNLTTLILRGHFVTDLSQISIMNKLTTLDLSNSMEEVKINVEGIGTKFPNLKSLTMEDYDTVDKLVAEIAQMKNLTTLNLGDTRIGNEGAIAIATNVRKLTTLILNNNRIGDEGAIALSNVTTLTTLDLSYNLIGDEGAIALSKLPKLTTLYLSHNSRIGNEGTIAISTMPNLKTLDLSATNVGDAGAIALPKLPKLETLRLCNVPLLKNWRPLHATFAKHPTWLSLEMVNNREESHIENLKIAKMLRAVYQSPRMRAHDDARRLAGFDALRDNPHLWLMIGKYLRKNKASLRQPPSPVGR